MTIRRLAIDQVRPDVQAELARDPHLGFDLEPGYVDRDGAQHRLERVVRPPVRVGRPRAEARRPGTSRRRGQRRGAGRPGSRRAAPSQRRPAPRRTAAPSAHRERRRSRSWRAPRPARRPGPSTSTSCGPGGPRRSGGPSGRRPGARRERPCTFQPWARAAETRHTWPVTDEGEPVPSWTPGTAYRPLLTLASRRSRAPIRALVARSGAPAGRASPRRRGPASGPRSPSTQRRAVSG